MMFRILGGPAAVIDGAEVPLSGQATRLLGILLADRNRAIAIEVIIDRLWDEYPAPRTAAKVVHVTIGRLRRTLDTDPDASSCITTTPAGYRLETGATDLDEYLEAVRDAEHAAPHDPERALNSLTRALGLWGGIPWGRQSGSPWLQPTVDALEEQHRSHEELWADLTLRCGFEDTAIDRLANAAHAEPLRERRWAQLMLALYRIGRQSEALRAYEEARSLLRGELGIEPGPELRRLELAVLQQDRSLARSAPLDGDKQHATATTFVGRQAEVARVEAGLVQNRVVTITGLGGVGKSRLATEVAHRRRLAGADVRWAALGNLDDEERLAGHIASELELHPEGDAPHATIAAALGSEPVLLVLDAVERVSSAAAAFALRVIEDCPRVRVLATSRVPLALSAGSTVELDPLPLPDPDGPVSGTALELLLDRIGLDLPALDGERRARLVAACAATAGVPLLVELTARTVDLAGPARPVAAATGDHNAAMRAAIDSALDEVDDPTRALASMGSPLPAGLSESLAALLLDVDVPAARRTLRQLAWTHLAPAWAGRASLRYRSLDPVRDVLVAELDAGAREQAIERAVTAVRTIFASLHPPAEPFVAGRLDALEDEHDNLRFLLADRMTHAPDDALRLAVVASEFWPIRGHIVEGRKWIEDALAAAQPQGELRWRGIVALAQTTRTFGEVAELRDELEGVVDEMRQEGADDILFGTGLLYLSMARGWRGDGAGAADAITQAEAINERIQSPWSAVHIRQLSSLGRAVAGDLAGAREGCLEFARSMEALDDRVTAAMGWYLAATLGDMAGRTDIADDIARARELASSHGDLALLGQLLRVEASLLSRTGDSRARAVLREATQELETRGGIRAAALGRRDLALAELEAGDYPAAALEARRSLPRLLRLEPNAAALSGAVLATIAARDGALDLASHLVRAALDWSQTWGASSPGDGARLAALLQDLPAPSTDPWSEATILERVGATDE